MLVTIHQPENLPWLGFFHKMNLADRYVILDTVQFTKNNVQNRNKIFSENNDFSWVSVPVSLKGHTSLTLKDTLISNENNPKWKKTYWGKIENTYRKHPYFKEYSEELKGIILEDCTKLVDFNMKIVQFFRDKLGINTEIIMASDLGVTGARSDLLLDICKKTEATTYLSGPSGRDYLNKEIFAESNIGLDYHQFNHPTYEAKRFVKYLSTLDLLMNCGPESREILFGN